MNSEGLSTNEAKKRLIKYGLNELPATPPPSDLTIFLSQLKSPLVYILIAAAAITFFLREFSDTIIISVAIAVNALLGFFQERKASNALFALKELISPQTIVVRNGIQKQIPLTEVVPGDVCVLRQGDKIPADGVVTVANRLFVSEAVLTGESVPVTKNEKSEVKMGTIVTAGYGQMEVATTGKETELGNIAQTLQEPHEDTPLKRQLTHFSKQLLFLVLVLTGFVFVFGLYLNLPFEEVLTTTVALAVSAIPEGLLIGMTAILAIGMQRLLRKKGLVRNLVSAETLGGVTTICVDKTGTLTQGNMQVVGVEGFVNEVALQSIIANDRDDPMVIAAFEWAKTNITKVADQQKRYARIDSFPFSAKERFFATITKWNTKNNMLFVNGAPEFLLSWSTLSKDQKNKILSKIQNYTQEGRRLIAFARKPVPKSHDLVYPQEIKNNLEWQGFLIFSDPIRAGVKSALQKTKSAGLKIIIITGDYTETAVSVLEELGIRVHDEVKLTGEELEKMSVKALQRLLKSRPYAFLFARTSPEQKLKIVQALKKNGEVVAMLGDGVNDAPALAKADIGIVVGDATDVAKESADLVLLDSSFSTIVAAIEEGRGVFDNIRKVILYLMSDAFGEIVAVIGSMLLGFPIAVTAAQILWINLVSDGFPHLALTVDPKRQGIMTEPPRAPAEPLVTNWMKVIIAVVSLSGGLFALLLFIFIYRGTLDVVHARSIAFASLGINSLIYVFSVRTLRESVWKENPFVNKWLIVAVFAGIILQMTPFFLPITRSFLEITRLAGWEWMLVFGTGGAMFLFIELLKLVFRQKLNRTLL